MPIRSASSPLSLLSLVLIVAGSAHAGAQTGPGRIVFQAVSENSGGLSVMDSDGKQQKVLAANAHAANWSKNSCKLLFSRGGSQDSIYVIDADGSNQKLVAGSVGMPPDRAEMRPHFSPDGRRIVFVSPSNDIVVVNSDGSGARKLTNGLYASEPTWSADGSKIHFVAIGPQTVLRVINVDGTNLQGIGTGREVQAAWSPDGTRIVFVASDESKTYIAVMNADGSNVKVLTDGSALTLLPSWSPDGSQIAFQVIRDDDISIDVINANGSGRKTVANHVFFEMAGGTPPSWSPDGSRIAFTRMPISVKELIAKGAEAYANAKFDVYAVNADGSNLKALTTTGGALHPIWSPTASCRATR